MGIHRIFILFCIASSVLVNGDRSTSSNFNVLDYGAAGNGRTDDSQAFLKAWNAVCGSTHGTANLDIPDGTTFFLTPTYFEGPCKSDSVIVQVSGTIVAPTHAHGWTNCHGNSWLSFSSVKNLVIHGTGEINGQGSLWWNGFKGTSGCQSRPTALHLNNCQNLQLTGLHHLNSPRNHISISNCNGVTISYLNITAPQSSPNTDGIDISSSTQINIHDSTIRTGDDCIAINGNSSYINITGIACGPGHGISVGSLGKDGAYETVEEVHVRNCSFSETMNGVRIKTWPGGSGYVRKISFEYINFAAAGNPIIIDQYYCNGEHNCKNMTSAVKISDVTYSYVRGTSAGKEAITLHCAETKCTNIIMQQINIRCPNCFAECGNVEGQATSTWPQVPCLTRSQLVGRKWRF